MGISVALTPATTTVTVSKSMITNASFRTKKLPGEYAILIYVFGQYLLILQKTKFTSQNLLIKIVSSLTNRNKYFHNIKNRVNN